jgi:hypothetical protein
VTEPSCHRNVGNVRVTPDAYVEVGSCLTGLKYSYWLEVDRGTEHLNQIEDSASGTGVPFRHGRKNTFRPYSLSSLKQAESDIPNLHA